MYQMIFSRNLVYINVENPSNIERKISDIAGAVSYKFKHGNAVENHLMAYLALGAAAATVNEAGVPLNQAIAFYTPAVIDAIVHMNDFTIPRIKTAIKNMLTENPYAGNGVPLDSP